MDKPWKLDDWKPSIYHIDAARCEKLERQAGETTIARAVECTQAIGQDPYNAGLWIHRAECLLRLGYPELAVGDAYKAGLLFDDQGIGERVSHDKHDAEHVKAHQVLVLALCNAHCHWEALQECQKAAKRFPQHAFFGSQILALKPYLTAKLQQVQRLGGTPSEQRDKLRDGGVITVVYPWMEHRHRKREQWIADTAEQEFHTGLDDLNQISEGGRLLGHRSNTPDSLAQASPAPCTLKQSSIGHQPTIPNATEEDTELGVFATRSIRRGERILIDRTATAACSVSSPANCSNCFGKLTSNRKATTCCSSPFCSPECLDLAMTTYHPALCGKDFDWLQSSAAGLTQNSSAMRPLLTLRFLAACVRAGASKHPLDHPLIARLAPQTRHSHVDVFTLAQSVVQPIKILQQLGVDVFANPNFDTWVLHTIWCRVANNKQGFAMANREGKYGFIDSVGPLFSFFNHSCEPNVRYVSENSSTVRFYAERDVGEGEELFNSYRDVEGLAFEERQEVLWPWFEGRCRCDKCCREGKG